MRLAQYFGLLFGCLLLVSPLIGCAQIEKDGQSPSSNGGSTSPQSSSAKPDETNEKESAIMETATFGGGCFWCVESVFLQLKGVRSIKSGYMGGKIENPTYAQICTGLTGHAEVIQIEYDPDIVSFDVLLQVFWKTHDPTTLNQQGVDRGTQYRSAVFFHNEQQQQKANEYKKKLNDVYAYPNPIVTEVTAASEFYVAEDEHQDYYNKNPEDRYCQFNIQPKLEKLKLVFGDKLKED